MLRFKNIKLKLRGKVIGGYLLIILLLIIVGAISLSRFSSLGEETTFLTEDVAIEVEAINEVVTEILSMRTSVEKFIAMKDERFKKMTDEHIKRVKSLMEGIKEKVTNKESLEKLDEVEKMVTDYIDTFQKMAIRTSVILKKHDEIFSMGREVEGALRLYPEAFEHMMAGQVFVTRFLINHNSYMKKEAEIKLEKAIESLGDEDEEVQEKVEEYLDVFVGLAAISMKMDEEVSKTLIPLAPRIVEKAEKIAENGWEQVRKTGQGIKQSSISARNLIIAIVIIALGMSVVIGIFMANIVTKPLQRMVVMLKDIAEGEGDLTKRLQVKSDDEVSEVAKWFNTFIEKLQDIIREVAGNSDVLDTSSTDLFDLSSHMSSEADNMSGKSNVVAAAAEEMSSNITTVATTMEDTSSSVEMVANSTEQMTLVINEISQNSEKARNITNNAVSQTQSASGKVNELGKAAQEIGQVTEAISEISEQVNLLALNATIEAARAGESGKGFAVVANEIKELAKQTAEATDEIKQQIESIQNSTEGTITEIEQISIVINDVNEIVSTIATAVEEQSVTTREIASNVSQASQGIQEVNQNVAQSSIVATDIARDILEMNQSAGEMSTSSSQVNTSAEEMSKLANQLKELVKRFKV